jgi:Arylsulfotransferase (ASST)
VTTDSNKTRNALFAVALLAAVLLAALVRFENITQVGMWTWPESGQYLYNALHFPTLGSESWCCFQPTAHLIHAAFLKVLGDTDYSLKVANCLFDLGNCVLIAVLILRMTRSRLLAFLGVVFYAFTPTVVFFARNELPHPIAALFAMLTLLAFMSYSERIGAKERRPGMFLALAGVLGGLAAGAHHALVFLGPAYLAGILLVIREKLLEDPPAFSWRRLLASLVRDAGCFALFFFLPLLVFAALIPVSEWNAAIAHNSQMRSLPDAWVAWKVQSQAFRAMTQYDFSVAESALMYLLVGLRWIAEHDGFYVDLTPLGGRGILSYAFLATPLVVLMVLALRPKRRLAASIVPLVLVVFSCLGCGLVSRYFALHSARCLLNLYPIIVVMVVAWYYRLFEALFPERLAVLVASGALVLLYAVQPHVYPKDQRLGMAMNVGKDVHKLIGGRVSADSKLLILPYDVDLIGEGQLTHRHLFGENAIRLRELPYTGDTLAEMCKKEKVKFVYISHSVSPFTRWRGFTRGYGPLKPNLPSPDFYGRDREPPEDAADVDKERLREGIPIAAFLKATNARFMWSDVAGELHELREYQSERRGYWWSSGDRAGTAMEPGNREQIESLGYLSGYEKASENEAITVHEPDQCYAGVSLCLSGHKPEAILMDLSGRTLHSWNHDFATEWPDYWRADFVGPELHQFWRRAHVFPNGDLLAVYEKLALVKLDKDSNVLWFRKFPHHHDLRVLADGRILILGTNIAIVERINRDREIFEDFIMLLDQDGNELERLSVLECLENSDYRTLLDTVELAGDFLHTNSVQRLDGRHADKVAAFADGNYLISLPFLNTVAVIDPRQRKVVWALTGLWCFQHDPDLLDNGNLLVFDNQGNGGMSKVVELDPQTQQIVWAYRGNEENGFYSEICGSNQRLPNGNTLIVETTGGRAFEVTPGGDIVWEYNNPNRAGDEGDLVAILPDVIRLPESFGQEWRSAAGPPTSAPDPEEGTAAPGLQN